MPGSVIFVSHDRYFMDHVVSVIWELDWGRLEVYNGNYSHYVRQREERHAAHWAEYEAQQEVIDKLNAVYKKPWSSSAGR